jgi:hypothetical protein
MSFSNNSSRTVLNDNATGVNLTLSNSLHVPTIYLGTQNLNTTLTNLQNKGTTTTTSNPSTLASSCNGTNLTLSGTLTTSNITNSGNVNVSGGLAVGDTLSTRNLMCSQVASFDGLSNTGTLNSTIISCNNLETNDIWNNGTLTNDGDISTTNGNITTTNGTISCAKLTCTGTMQLPNTSKLSSVILNTINQSSYYTVRGTITNTGGTTTYSNTFYDASTSTSSGFQISIPSNCISFVVNYSYYTNAVNQYGLTPYYFFKTEVISGNTPFTKVTGTAIGSNTYQPTQSVTTTNQSSVYNVTLPTPSNNSDVFYTFSIWFY